MHIELPTDVLFIINKIREFGYRADVVGGAVRDSIIGRELGDFDITTNALPEKTKEIFAGYRIIDTGIKHGTVTLVIGKAQYEITTYRIDGGYTDNRHPDSVSFTSDIVEDLARRDFTVNAIAYNPYDGLTDPYGGRSDVDARIIKAVGDPRVRFDEDALRILRALRFSSALDFDIDDETAEAIRDKYTLLSGVSRERVYTELKKLVMGERAINVFREYSEVFSYVLGGITPSVLPDADLYGKADYLTRLASLFYLNSDKPDTLAYETLTMLKTDKHTRERVSSVLGAYNGVGCRGRVDIVHALAEYGYDIVKGVFDLRRLLADIGNDEYLILEDIMETDPVYSISQLAVGGKELMALGYTGEAIGKALKELLFRVIEGKVENTKEDLVASLMT